MGCRAPANSPGLSTCPRRRPHKPCRGQTRSWAACHCPQDIWCRGCTYPNFHSDSSRSCTRRSRRWRPCRASPCGADPCIVCRADISLWDCSFLRRSHLKIHGRKRLLSFIFVLISVFTWGNRVQVEKYRNYPLTCEELDSVKPGFSSPTDHTSKVIQFWRLFPWRRYNSTSVTLDWRRSKSINHNSNSIFYAGHFGTFSWSVWVRFFQGELKSITHLKDFLEQIYL